MVTNEPGLKYKRFIAFSTLHALLRIDPHKAYKYGRMMSYKDPSYDAIIGTIKEFPCQYNTLPAEIFELGAEACQAEIDLYPWTTKLAQNYFRMAEWYLPANNKLKAKNEQVLPLVGLNVGAFNYTMLPVLLRAGTLRNIRIKRNP